jgi:hypothetical protein
MGLNVVGRSLKELEMSFNVVERCLKELKIGLNDVWPCLNLLKTTPMMRRGCCKKLLVRLPMLLPWFNILSP